MDASIKFIIGELNEDGYKKAIETWTSRGGDKIIKEYTDLYKKFNAIK